MKTLHLFRGLPGSGKTTQARALCPLYNFSADDYFYVGGEYEFDVRWLGKAHERCQRMTKASLGLGVENVAVHNTFAQSWEAAPYFRMAEEHGYQIVVHECTGDFGSVHNVPEATIEKMRERYEESLTPPAG